MKKYLTKGRIVSYLLYLSLACSVVFGVSYAQYSATVSGSQTATVAKGDIKLEAQPIIKENPGLNGDEYYYQTVPLLVTNTGEVAVECSLTLEYDSRLLIKYCTAQNGNYVLYTDKIGSFNLMPSESVTYYFRLQQTKMQPTSIKDPSPLKITANAQQISAAT